ncbi:MAG: PTS lactose/cellobiose transporter subunit IIA [Lachnospiraceae bacterium]
MERTMEQIIMELVVNGGDARSSALEAIRAAREKDFEEATACLKRADEALHRAHEIQTSLIQKEAGGEHIEVQLLMVHAQDHLMNAMTVKDLAVEIIELCR